MNYYFAPLEGVTGYALRNVHHTFFSADPGGKPCGVTEYFTPFAVAGYTHKFKTREQNDLLPSNNLDLHGVPVPVVPQILANHAQDVLWAARYLAGLGYTQMNLNLGCPVSTVTSKGKGSGMLKDPEVLQSFLEEVFEGICSVTVSTPDGAARPMALSVKTRLGFESTEEAAGLLRLFAQYPLAELILHARTTREYYSGRPHVEQFAALFRAFPALQRTCGTDCRTRLVYNGSLQTKEDLDRFRVLCPECDTVMIGRGLVSNPGLVRHLCTGIRITKKELRDYHEALLAQYEFQFRDEHVLINRMKEVWTYMGRLFQDEGRCLKAIHKAGSRMQYDAAVRTLFDCCGLTDLPDGL